MTKKSTYKDFIRQENELTKLKIQAEFGIDLAGENDLNPAIENIWLNQILEYERSMIHNKKTTVSGLLGKPDYIPVNKLTNDQLPFELQRLMEMMHAKKIIIDSISGIDDREMYRFITEELFETEVDSCVPGNMIICFVYEEFHPNDEYDLKHMCHDFLQKIGTGFDWSNYAGYNNIDNDSENAKIENIIHKLELFDAAFDDISVEEIEIQNTLFFETTAVVTFAFTIVVLPPGSRKRKGISGKGMMEFKKDHKFWLIDNLIMNGVL